MDSRAVTTAMIISVVVVMMIGVDRVEGMFDCTKVTTGLLVPNDPNFSENACIIIADFTVPDCSLAAPSPYEPDAPLVMCPGVPIQPTEVVDGSQTFYNDLAYALQNCPYDPVLIEFIGVIYVPNVTNFIYNQSKDLIIRGVSQITEIPGSNVTELQMVFNSTTNMTEIVEVVTGVNPPTTITLQSTIVGFKDLQVMAQNISVSLENFVAEGCETDRGVFMTIACPERCDLDLTKYCRGNWYPKSLNVTQNGLCTNTGAYFNGTQRIAFQNASNGNYGKYNGALPSDTKAFQFKDVTVEAWINPVIDPQVSWAGVVGNYRYGNAKESRAGYGLFYDKDDHYLLHFRVAYSDYKFVECTQAIAPTTWTHVAGTYSSGTGVLSMYINGFLACNATGQIKPPYYGTNAQRTMTVGAFWFDIDNGGSDNDRPYYFRGVVDEVRVWNVTRTSAQIQFAYNSQIATTTTGLVAYLKFSRGANFFDNAAQANTPGLPTPKVFAQNTVGDNITAVDDCFCLSNTSTECVPTEGQVQIPPGAVTMILSTDNITNYEFVYSVVVEPNGPYGLLFMPAVTNTTGFIYNQTVHIIPGIYENVTFSGNFSGNSTSNTTTESCFTPGVIPSTLPPQGTYLQNLTFFTPGWFFNNGEAPFSSLNFVPGIFVDAGSAINVTEGCPTIFVPGIEYPDGTFVPFGPMSMQALMVAMMGSPCWGLCNEFVDPCYIKNLTVTPTVPPPITVIANSLGCFVSPADPVVTYLNHSDRSPCSVLQHAIDSLPVGFQSFTEAQASLCTIGPHDPEPTYLSKTARDPCFVVRDLRNLAVINNTLNCTNGEVPYPPEIMPCLKNQNLTLFAMTVQNYWGEKAVCQHACEEYVALDVSHSNFTNIPGSALWNTGLHYYTVHDSNFCPCGGTTEACVYLNGNHIAYDGVYYVYNNRHCAIEDLLPYECSYDISYTLTCSDGFLQCLDIVSTLQEECQQVEVAPNVFRFDSDCAVYAPCVCGSEDQNVTLPDGSVVTVSAQTGDVEIAVDYVTPLVLDLLGGNATLILKCDTEVVSQPFTYDCLMNVTVEVTIGNVTMNTTVEQLTNCTSFQNVTVGNINALPCPCPDGFNASLTTNLTGSAAAQALGLYTTCQWDLPDGLPGEMCVDQVVWCPYEGGTLGDPNPPPVPPEKCFEGTVILPCTVCNINNGTEYYYENFTYPCPAECSSPPSNATNATATYFTTNCFCDNFTITEVCTRDITCFNPSTFFVFFYYYWLSGVNWI